MNFLNSEEQRQGPETFLVLVSALVPLFITYRWLDGRLALAVPAAAVLWFGVAALWRLAWLPVERKRERELSEAWEREAERRRKLGTL